MKAECLNIVNLGVSKSELSKRAKIHISDFSKFLKKDIYFSDVILDRLEFAITSWYKDIENAKQRMGR